MHSFVYHRLTLYLLVKPISSEVAAFERVCFNKRLYMGLMFMVHITFRIIPLDSDYSSQGYFLFSKVAL